MIHRIQKVICHSFLFLLWKYIFAAWKWSFNTHPGVQKRLQQAIGHWPPRLAPQDSRNTAEPKFETTSNLHPPNMDPENDGFPKGVSFSRAPFSSSISISFWGGVRLFCRIFWQKKLGTWDFHGEKWPSRGFLQTWDEFFESQLRRLVPLKVFQRIPGFHTQPLLFTRFTPTFRSFKVYPPATFRPDGRTQLGSLVASAGSS